MLLEKKEPGTSRNKQITSRDLLPDVIDFF